MTDRTIFDHWDAAGEVMLAVTDVVPAPWSVSVHPDSCPSLSWDVATDAEADNLAAELRGLLPDLQWCGDYRYTRSERTRIINLVRTDGTNCTIVVNPEGGDQ